METHLVAGAGVDPPGDRRGRLRQLSGKQVNPRTATFTLKKGGEAVGTTTRTVSKDGKMLTSKTSVTRLQGDKVEKLMVFDKQ